MLEVVVFTGIAWKLRATYYSGNVSLIHKTVDPLFEVSNSSTIGVGGTMDVDVIGSGDFNITFLLMPFSMKWDK